MATPSCGAPRDNIIIKIAGAQQHHRANKLEPILCEEGGEFSTMPPSRAPSNFDWTKLAHAQLGYGAYNIRPYLGLCGI